MLEFGIGVVATSPLLVLMLWWLRHPVAKPRVFPRVLAAIVVSTVLLAIGLQIGTTVWDVDRTHPGLWMPLPLFAGATVTVGTKVAAPPEETPRRH